MGADHLILEAQSHDEVYRAMLRAEWRKHGAVKEFAERTGIASQAFLSYVIGPHPQRNLSPKLAAIIANTLPWDAMQRESFTGHVSAAYEFRRKSIREQRQQLASRTLHHLVEELHLSFIEAISGADHTVVKRHYAAVAERGKSIFSQSSPRSSALDFVELCLMLSNVLSVLDQAHEALFYARYAHKILSERERADYASQVEQFDHLLIQSLEMQSSALHILGLEREAYDLSGPATRWLLTQIKSPLWEARASSQPIFTLCETPRFSLREVKSLARDVSVACEMLAKKDEIAARKHQFNLHRALGLAYLRYGNLPEAERVLRPLLDQHQKIPELGLIHQVSFLRDLACQRLLVGDEVEFAELVKRALSIAVNAGFDHQIRKLRRIFGDTIQSIFEESTSNRNMPEGC